MTSEEYLGDLLRKYRANPNAHQSADVVVPYIRTWASNNSLPIEGIFYSGSYAKGTATSLSSDIDLFISIGSSCQASLKDIYDSLAAYMTTLISIRKQNVSIRINNNGVNIDLVPAKKHPGNTNDHSLYKLKQDSWIKTNVSAHINLISKSIRKNEIKLVKIWRDLHGLEMSSILLELLVIDALNGKLQGQVEQNFLTALTYLQNRIETVRTMDPANTNNVLSDDLTTADKKKISFKAANALSAKYWSEVVW